MQRVSFSETDTFAEVNKVLNMLIDAHNENELGLSMRKSKKKSKKKKGAK